MRAFPVRQKVTVLLNPKVGKRLKESPVLALAGIAVLFVSGSALAAQTLVSYTTSHSQDQPPRVTTTGSKNTPGKFTTNAKSVTTANNPETTKSSQQPVSSAATQSSNQPAIKYSVSPDPRSTAYSTTPPPPNPASFNITITRNGQVAPGTEISYNATKDAKTYYAGDFGFSVPSVTIYKSRGLYSSWFTVSTPDGQTANEPALPWYANEDYFPNVSGTDGPGTSWTMAIDILNSLPNGTYQVHLTSFRTGGGADAWEYDGFITLNVES